MLQEFQIFVLPIPCKLLEIPMVRLTRTYLIGLVAGIMLLSGCTEERAAPPSFSLEDEKTAIQQVLALQQDAWNAGDIDTFMSGYWRSDSLRFVSNNASREGWNATLERYRTSYPDRAAMGALTFELYEIKVLSLDAATVFGRFTLKRDEELGDLTGLFTLIFRNIAGEWKVVHDHTSV